MKVNLNGTEVELNPHNAPSEETQRQAYLRGFDAGHKEGYSEALNNILHGIRTNPGITGLMIADIITNSFPSSTKESSRC